MIPGTCLEEVLDQICVREPTQAPVLLPTVKPTEDTTVPPDCDKEFEFFCGTPLSYTAEEAERCT